jgi:hypothetical protein
MGLKFAMNKYMPPSELDNLPLRHLLIRFDKLKQALTPNK